MRDSGTATTLHSLLTKIDRDLKELVLLLRKELDRQ